MDCRNILVLFISPQHSSISLHGNYLGLQLLSYSMIFVISSLTSAWCWVGGVNWVHWSFSLCNQHPAAAAAGDKVSGGTLLCVQLNAFT